MSDDKGRVTLDEYRNEFEKSHPYPVKPKRIWKFKMRGVPTKQGAEWNAACVQHELKFLDWLLEKLRRDGNERREERPKERNTIACPHCHELTTVETDETTMCEECGGAIAYSVFPIPKKRR